MLRYLVGLLVLLVVLSTAFGAPGDVKTNSVTLSWDLATSGEYITHHKLYVMYEFPPGFPMTNAPWGSPLEWWPGPQGTWQLLTNITNLASDGRMLNVTNVTVALTNSTTFFTITANNVLGESDFSNVAWIPSRPVATNRFWLLSVE